MSVQVGTITTAARIAFCCAMGLYACSRLMGQMLDGAATPSSALAVHSFVTYGLTLLSFVAFPKTRRTDLAKVMILTNMLIAVARTYLGLGFEPPSSCGDVLGPLAVIAPYFTERCRALYRADPTQVFSTAYPGDRRRKRRTTRRSQSVSGYVDAPSP